LHASKSSLVACEYVASGFTWADAAPHFIEGAETCVQCRPGKEPTTVGYCSNGVTGITVRAGPGPPLFP
jgi:hypothetical protein